jgi:dolichyl-phosphate-mannose--protein O-mannosyl transferase
MRMNRAESRAQESGEASTAASFDSAAALAPAFPTSADRNRINFLTDGRPAPAWSRADTIVLCALLVAAIGTRCWRLGWPAGPVFDERLTIPEAREVLRGLPFRDYHPPLTGYLMGLSIQLLGDIPAGWRAANAVCGSFLVAVTYLLGRRMFGSRLAGACAAAFVLFDGFFLVESRYALMDIFHVTFGACAYLMLFRFGQQRQSAARRRTVFWMAVALGLDLGSKILIPIITTGLVGSFLIVSILAEHGVTDLNSLRSRRPPGTDRQIMATLGLVGGVCALLYVMVFLPNYWHGWWHGAGDYISYLGWSVHYNQAIKSDRPYASHWWSWPFMLRPLFFWSDTFLATDTVLVLGFGNPVIWWGVVVAIVAVAVQVASNRSVPRAFLLSGYAAYMLMWVPISRFTLLYHYMSALYVGTVALGAVVAECWEGKARSWVPAGLLLCVIPALIFGGGLVGWIAAIALAAGYAVMARRDARQAGRFVALVFMLMVLATFVYCFPIWTGGVLPLAALRDRIWFYAPVLKKWGF